LGQEAQDVFEERLHDNTMTPPPDQAAFRIDFPAWRRTRSERDRRVIDELMAGGRTKDVSAKLGMSPGRVSQCVATSWRTGTASPAKWCDARTS
jgi:hypothetical protein